MNTRSPLGIDLIPDFVTLSDGRRGVRTGLAAEIREPAPQPGASPAVLDFIASSDALDRCGEIIDPFGWQLDNYRRNPVFQNAHQYGDIIFTLGKALITQVRHLPGADGELRPALYQRIEFAVEANPMARIAFGLYKGKFLNAVSVGFIPLRWVDAEGTEHGLTERERRGGDVNAQTKFPMNRNSNSTSPQPLSSEERGASLDASGRFMGSMRGFARGNLTPTPLPWGEGKPLETGTRGLGGASFRRKYIFQELLEVSAVGIPANPEALQLGLKAGAIQKSDVQDLLDLLAKLSHDTAPLTTAALTAAPLITDPLITDYCPPEFRSHTAGVVANPSARGDDADGAQLLQLARALTKLLRRT